MTAHLPNNQRQYVTIEIELEPHIYNAAQASLHAISSSVEEYCALCLYKTVRYMQELPACATMSPEQLAHKVSSDVIEELELCHANKPQFKTARGVHADQEEQWTQS